MPDLTKWVRCAGKTYCWDKTAGKVIEVQITDVPFDQVPKAVLIAMLNSTSEDGTKTNGITLGGSDA